MELNYDKCGSGSIIGTRQSLAPAGGLTRWCEPVCPVCRQARANKNQVSDQIKKRF
jgi:hypothetical protein